MSRVEIVQRIETNQGIEIRQGIESEAENMAKQMLKKSDTKETSTNLKTIVVTILKFGVSFLILAYLFNQAWKHDQFARLAESPKHFGWLALGIVSGFAACVVAFFRWHILVRTLGLKFKVMDAVRLGFLGHLFNLMSFGVLGGDAIKSMFIAKQMKGKATEAVASVFADRALGLLAMFAFAGIAFLVSDFSQLEAENPEALASIQMLCKFALLCTAIAATTLCALFIFKNWKRTWFFRKLNSIPKIGPIIERLLDVIDIYRSRLGVLGVCFGISLFSISLFAVSIYSVARGISESFPSIWAHLVIAPIAMVANAVPLPGGLGGMEFALDFMYRGFSQAEIPSEHGFVVALGFRVILLMVAAIGIFVYLTKKREIDDLNVEA